MFHSNSVEFECFSRLLGLISGVLPKQHFLLGPSKAPALQCRSNHSLLGVRMRIRLCSSSSDSASEKRLAQPSLRHIIFCRHSALPRASSFLNHGESRKTMLAERIGLDLQVHCQRCAKGCDFAPPEMASAVSFLNLTLRLFKAYGSQVP